MAYCGSVGSVNVLASLSADLFDESQENPFLLQHRSPSRVHSSQLAPPFTKESELPLSDTCQSSKYDAQSSRAGSSIRSSPHSQPTSPHCSSRRTVFVDTNATPRCLLKQQSNNVSHVSTKPSFRGPQQSQLGIDKLVTSLEMHKMLCSLSHCGLTDDASEIPPDACQRSNLMASRKETPNRESRGAVPNGYYSCDETDRRTNMTTRKRSRRQNPCVLRQDMCKSRGSVTFTTVKNLLRGGGVAGRTTLKGAPDAPHLKTITGTISSRLKANQKFVRPAILTDAFLRVSDMKLGTKSLKAQVKHMAFPQQWEKDFCRRASRSPSPKGQVPGNDSFVTLETLDKIGTRAACPVHLLDEEKADYSRVSARVDCYNHVRSPKRSLQRPSTWLAGAALDARVGYYENA